MPGGRGQGEPLRLMVDVEEGQDFVDLFVYRVGREIGSLAAALGGLDTLVFTAGIGEHPPVIPRRICEAAAWLGVVMHDGLNRSGEGLVSAANSHVDVLVIPADEERAVATELLGFETV